MVDVASRHRQLGVTELLLDQPQIDPLAGELEGVRVPQAVGMDSLLDMLRCPP